MSPICRFQKTFSRWKRIFLIAGVLGCAGYGYPEESLAYVMPSEQILQFMAANFSKFQTLVVNQTTEISEESEPRIIEEIVTMKSPNLFHSKVISSDAKRRVAGDRAYLSLFLANNASWLMNLLSEKGIVVQKTEYTRVEGLIAFRIGDKEQGRPKLLVEKARFLPLLIQYGSSDQPGEDLVQVRFRDYRKVGQGWYPFEILYSRGEKVTEKHMVRSVKTNVAVSLSLFNSPE